MIKLVYCISKKAGLTDEEFFRYWKQVHGPIGARIPRLRRLVQSRRFNIPGDKYQPDYDGMAELWFDDVEALLAARQSREWQLSHEDERNFVDHNKVAYFVSEEETILDEKCDNRPRRMEAAASCSSLLKVDNLSPERARWYCSQLEQGSVLYFPTLPFQLAESDRKFLLSLKPGGSRFHKNISYRPAADALKGVSGDSEDRARLHRVMRGFSEEVARFVASLLPPYAGQLQRDYASFRPLEEKGRDLPLHQRNDLLHVDAFPSRPTRGARILRVFVNINPGASRIWNVGQPFHVLFPEIARGGKLDPPHRGKVPRALARLAARLGLPARDRSRYDEFMLYLHDWLKENADFQTNSPQRELAFPPGCCWMVFTDGVPHAARSGQFALEQTFLIPRQALVSPEAAPVSVLESVTGKQMAS